MKYLACLAFFVYAWHLTVGCQTNGENCDANITCCAGHHCKITNPPGGSCERGSLGQPATSRPDSSPAGGGHGHGSPSSMNDESISKSEFDQAFTSNKFKAPPPAHYDAFVSPSVKRLHRITLKREFAMFLANVIHETAGLEYLEEINGATRCAAGEYRGVWDPNPATFHMDKCYCGRGPLQLSHPQNYQDASLAIFKDAATLIDNPERVLTDKQTGWDTAAWYWGEQVGIESGVKEGQFGTSIKAINGKLECPVSGEPAKNPNEAAKRKEYYEKIYKVWGIEGPIDLSGC
ncbi:putative Endochitinase EP3 [Hypsibius exemplaris]|uniref:Endochitinase EP3 n=1 Tax=Hypsibius exemplaris TaxID=2072580 RepID=A0A9X6ND03_HYPEX|nr:putative Endochitinase EP3 [Hypsibius exemplaris]